MKRRSRFRLKPHTFHKQAWRIVDGDGLHARLGIIFGNLPYQPTRHGSLQIIIPLPTELEIPFSLYPIAMHADGHVLGQHQKNEVNVHLIEQSRQQGHLILTVATTVHQSLYGVAHIFVSTLAVSVVGV